MRRDRQCLFRVVYQPAKNKMIGKINALELYEFNLPEGEFDLQIHSVAVLKILKKFVSDVIRNGRDDGFLEDESMQTTRAVVKYLEDTSYCCTEYKDKYEYILIISLR